MTNENRFFTVSGWSNPLYGSQKIQSSSLNNSRMLGILAVTLVPTLFDIRNKTFKRSRLEFRHLLQNFSLSVTLDYNLLDLRREREVVSQTNIILKSNFLLFEVSVSQIDRYLALEIFTQYLCLEQWTIFAQLSVECKHCPNITVHNAIKQALVLFTIRLKDYNQNLHQQFHQV